MTASRRIAVVVVMSSVLLVGCGHQLYRVAVDQKCEANISSSGDEGSTITVHPDCTVMIEPEGESNGNPE